MKTVLLSLVLPWCLTGATLGENIKDSALYKTGVQLLEAADTEGEYVYAAEYFMKIAESDTAQWLPRYYAGVCFNMASGENQNGRLKEQLIDRAEGELEKALAINPDEPELIILQAFILQARIQVNPATRGMSYSSKAVSLLDKALKADPGNPRAVMLKAYNIYYTPALLKGGASNALPVFIKARKMFASYVPDSQISPQWGEKETLNMINICEKEISQK